MCLEIIFVCLRYTYVHMCLYINIHNVAKQGGGVNRVDLGQEAHHPLYFLQLQNHPHPLPAPGGRPP